MSFVTHFAHVSQQKLKENVLENYYLNFEAILESLFSGLSNVKAGLLKYRLGRFSCSQFSSNSDKR